MKRIVFLIMISAFTSLSLFAQDDKRIEGFRDFQWGAHIDSIFRDGEQVSFVMAERNDENDNDGTYYRLGNENLLIGNVMLTDILYVFSEDDDRLFKVLLVGRKSDVNQMEFIVDYKYGENANEDVMDDQVIKQWIVSDVTLSLLDYTYNKFELELKSDWQAAQAYARNTNVSDF